ncbi:hypothetical protein SNE40_000686 [Patella caerulea]|uniref:TauD/TfdA-like domain-containing protein n=1 Tax=Patella caerulea TaxID=87958 RepID=A0AAN8KLW2_PATCE
MHNLAPLSTIPQIEVKQFYAAYNRLGTKLENPSNELWLKLKPGMVLLVDNWRILHDLVLLVNVLFVVAISTEMMPIMHTEDTICCMEN